jgi:hypothetical protein
MNPRVSVRIACCQVVWLAAAGCVEPNRGSRIVANFQGLAPAIGVHGAGRLVSPHYAMWATIRQDVVVQLVAFDVAPVVDPNSPCLYYDAPAEEAFRGEVHAGEAIMAPIPDGDPPHTQADKAWLQNRVRLLSVGNFAVVSASDGFNGQTTIDRSLCQGTNCWLNHAGIDAGSLRLTLGGTTMTAAASCAAAPPAGSYCLEPSSGRLTLAATDLGSSQPLAATYRAHLALDEATAQHDPMSWSNAERLANCTRLTKAGPVCLDQGQTYDPGFYIGNVLQMSAPRTGVFYGMVDALDPNAGLPLGGIVVEVPYGLRDATELYVTVEDKRVGAPCPTIDGQIDPARRGTVVLTGVTHFGNEQTGRGLMTADLAAPVNISFTAGAPGGHVSIYTQLDEDNVQF